MGGQFDNYMQMDTVLTEQQIRPPPFNLAKPSRAFHQCTGVPMQSVFISDAEP